MHTFALFLVYQFVIKIPLKKTTSLMQTETAKTNIADSLATFVFCN